MPSLLPAPWCPCTLCCDHTCIASPASQENPRLTFVWSLVHRMGYKRCNVCKARKKKNLDQCTHRPAHRGLWSEGWRRSNIPSKNRTNTERSQFVDVSTTEMKCEADTQCNFQEIETCFLFIWLRARTCTPQGIAFSTKAMSCLMFCYAFAMSSNSHMARGVGTSYMDWAKAAVFSA